MSRPQEVSLRDSPCTSRASSTQRRPSDAASPPLRPPPHRTSSQKTGARREGAPARGGDARPVADVARETARRARTRSASTPSPRAAPRRRPDTPHSRTRRAAAARRKAGADHATASTSDAAALHPPGHQPSLGDPRRRPTAVGGPASSSRASSSSSERTTRRSQSLGSRRRGVRLDDGDRARVKAQQDLQEGLTDELVALVGGVRANATAMERSLELSRRELDRYGVRSGANVVAARWRFQAGGGV